MHFKICSFLLAMILIIMQSLCVFATSLDEVWDNPLDSGVSSFLSEEVQSKIQQADEELQRNRIKEEREFVNAILEEYGIEDLEDIPSSYIRNSIKNKLYETRSQEDM